MGEPPVPSSPTALPVTGLNPILLFAAFALLAVGWIALAATRQP